MCGMCSDYVTSCWVCTQTMRGGKGIMGKQFYLDSTFCEHFVERYRTDSPSMYSHVERDHYNGDEDGIDTYSFNCEDNCIANGWYTEEHLRAVVVSFNIYGAA